MLVKIELNEVDAMHYVMLHVMPDTTHLMEIGLKSHNHNHI